MHTKYRLHQTNLLAIYNIITHMHNRSCMSRQGPKPAELDILKHHNNIPKQDTIQEKKDRERIENGTPKDQKRS